MRLLFCLSVCLSYNITEPNPAQGEVWAWNLTRVKLLHEDDSGKVSQSRREEFGIYLEELPDIIYFQSHGWIFHKI